MSVLYNMIEKGSLLHHGVIEKGLLSALWCDREKVVFLHYGVIGKDCLSTL